MKEQTVCDCEKLTTSDVDGSTFDGPINKLKKTECIKWLLCRNIKPHHKDTLASVRVKVQQTKKKQTIPDCELIIRDSDPNNANLRSKKSRCPKCKNNMI
ncbi:unnamed protein product [Owenia fusiformis]|uniref:Uncharacterized protein n=1 Tax=Owenia fusiformis TaxID=6347 RepID=A0A8S4MYX8_OWEFU|nr:unnamed protein product [Owenia fusiformis]